MNKDIYKTYNDFINKEIYISDSKFQGKIIINPSKNGSELGYAYAKLKKGLFTKYDHFIVLPDGSIRKVGKDKILHKIENFQKKLNKAINELKSGKDISSHTPVLKSSENRIDTIENLAKTDTTDTTESISKLSEVKQEDNLSNDKNQTIVDNDSITPLAYYEQYRNEISHILTTYFDIFLSINPSGNKIGDCGYYCCKKDKDLDLENSYSILVDGSVQCTYKSNGDIKVLGKISNIENEVKNGIDRCRSYLNKKPSTTYNMSSYEKYRGKTSYIVTSEFIGYLHIEPIENKIGNFEDFFDKVNTYYILGDGSVECTYKRGDNKKILGIIPSIQNEVEKGICNYNDLYCKKTSRIIGNDSAFTRRSTITTYNADSSTTSLNAVDNSETKNVNADNSFYSQDPNTANIFDSDFTIDKHGVIIDMNANVKGALNCEGEFILPNGDMPFTINEHGQVVDKSTNNTIATINERGQVIDGNSSNVLGYIEDGRYYKKDCFISTACVEAKDLPDNCFELMALRHFRDNYLLKSLDGKQAIKHYYNIAPQIVNSIDSEFYKNEYYKDLYKNLVMGSLKLIAMDKNFKAFENYEKIVRELEDTYKPIIIKPNHERKDLIEL